MIVSKIFIYIFITYMIETECRSVQYPITSDVIVTKWPEDNAKKIDNYDDDKQPGWMRKQLMRFGEVTSKIGNAMGSHATKITSAIDKICEVVKTVIPLLAAVCHVGQFKFCAATMDAPDQISAALSPTTLNLNELDK